MSKWFSSIFLLGVFTLSPSAESENFQLNLEYLNETCSSLNNYRNNYAMCVNAGFTYPELEVEYNTAKGERVKLSVQQARAGRELFDSNIKSAKIYCGSCMPSDMLLAMGRVVDGLSTAVNSGHIRARNVSAGGSWKREIAEDIFSGVAANTVMDIGKSLLEDSQDSENTGKAYILVLNSDGKPRASGYIENGKLTTSIVLQPNGNGQYEWVGRISRREYYDATSKNAWGGFTSGSARSCRITVTGSSERMVARFSCWDN